MTSSYRSGFVTLIGRPNAGKSTLLNALVGQKVSITSRRPQTTRHRILGIKTTAETQIVYVDTPGVHQGGKRAIHQYMNRTAAGSVEGVDCIVLVITTQGWREEDEAALALARKQNVPVILVINKIDWLEDKAALLPLIEASRTKADFADIVPISALKRVNIEDLERTLLRYLPEQPPLFPEEQVSDRSDRFMAAELVREQVFHNLGEELPYACSVEIEQFKQEKKLLRIEAVIWIEKAGQKGILIGKDGQRLKLIGQKARLEMERVFGTKVFLSLWVKVKEGWSDDARALKSLGYTED